MSSLSLFSKARIILTRPKVALVLGKGAKEVICQVLKGEGKPKKGVLVEEADLEKIEEAKFLIGKASLPILVISQLAELPLEKIRELIKVMPSYGFLILNFDEETVRGLKGESVSRVLTFGFQPRADFWASDVKINGGTNFKINYQGKVVPIWLGKTLSQKEVYSVLVAITVGVVLDINLVEISQRLKDLTFVTE